MGSVKKFLVFQDLGYSSSGKTKRWKVLNLGQTKLGYISWLGRWRRYVFHPDEDMIFDSACLKQIAEFLDEKMEERKS
jgi:hypothetical protein